MAKKSIFKIISENISSLNNSKFFAGAAMIMLNIGSKLITINLSKSAEQYLKYTVSKQLIVFSMAWMGSRDIYTALSLTAIFTILSDYIFNEESNFCIVPEQYRVLNKAIDENNDGKIDQYELAKAIKILENAKKTN